MNNNTKGLLITAIGVLIMSLESLFIKFTTISPFLFSFYIGIFMFIATGFSVVVKKGKKLDSFKEGSLFILVLCGSLMAVSNIFFISAIKTTTVANVVIIFSTSVLFSALFAYLFYKEKITKNIFIASFFMFIGLYVIFKDALGFGDLKGNLFALICTVLFSISFVLLSRHKEVSRVAVALVTGIVLGSITFFLVPSFVIDFNTLWVLMAMGLLITPISRILIGNGTKYLSASEVSLLMIIETIMAPIWVWLVLNEIPASNTFLGGAIILLTLIVNSIYTMNRKA